MKTVFVPIIAVVSFMAGAVTVAIAYGSVPTLGDATDVLVLPPLVTSTTVARTTTMPAAATTTTLPATTTPSAAVTLGQRFGGFSTALEHVQFLPTADIDRQADLIAELGGGWLRGDYMWSHTEAIRGVYTWDDQDRWIRAAVARGIKPLPILYFTPAWARPGSSNDKHVPANLSDYGTWVGNACQHLWALGVRHVELWNEQNLSGFFEPLTSDADRDNYIFMAKDASTKCKAVTPDMFVLAGGLSTSDTVFQRHGGSPNGALNTMAYYASHGLYEYVDGQAWHPYLDGYEPGSDANGWPRWAPDAIADGLAILDSGAPGRNLQLWSTESAAPRSDTSADEQANRARLAYESFLPGGFAFPYRDRLGPLLWFCVRNRAADGDGGVDDLSREDSFGLTTADFSYRFPAFDAVKSALHEPIGP